VRQARDYGVKKLTFALVFILGLAALTAAWAQTYPSHPITIIVPFAPGGQTDTIARIMAERMTQLLDQPVVVENFSGASGTIGVGRVARAAPDGYTIVIGNTTTHVFNGMFYVLPYDVQQDFEPVALLASQPMLILGRRNLPAKNLLELIAWLKANPGRGTEGTSGAGSVAHVCGLLLQKMTGTDFQFVPYRGSEPTMQDLAAGQIDFTFDTPTSLPYVNAGLIKAYAVTATTRSLSAPDIPTVDEAGLPGLYLSLWSAFWVRKGTPSDIVSKLNAAVMETLADTTVRKRFAEQAQDIPPREQQTAQALAAFQEAEIKKWWPIMKAANVHAQ
jgi:tripartite-type tricarboxylate transporter receptor subunit TctC